MEKIVLIGAGSAVFTRGLVADLIRTGWQAELRLVDTNPQALAVAQQLAAKMIALKQAPIRLSADPDRRSLLPGASAVICTIGVGGRRAWEQDVFIPRRHGIFMPVGDTVGPGGTSRALRMIPPMVAIAQDVLELCPQALFFNYGNPMAAICRAVRKATGANVTGLCHGVPGTAQYLARALGVAPNRLGYTGLGINHLTWLFDFTIDGQEAAPRLQEIASQRLAAAVGGCPPGASPYESPCGDAFSWQLYHLFGAFPAPQDRHVVEFFPQFYRTGDYFGRQLGVDVFSFEGTIADGDAGYALMQAHAASPDPLPVDYFEHFSGEHEQVLEIISAIRQGDGRVFFANLPNHGRCPNWPAEAVLEGPAASTKDGLIPLAVPPLSAGLAGTLATRFQWVEATVEAALERSRDKFIQALVLDGAVSSLREASSLADDLLKTQAPYLDW
jgi:alpha-galactosidase